MLTIEFINGKFAIYEGETAVKVEDAINRAVNIGDQATSLIKIREGKFIRIFINAINCIVVEQ